MLLARLWRVLLLAVFLLAQQSALAHCVWHVASGVQQSQSDPGLPKSHPLCDQHVAMGAVLGALSGSSGISPVAETAPLGFPVADAPAAALDSLPPASRGPPAAL